MELIRVIPNQSIEWKLTDQELDLFHRIEELNEEMEVKEEC